MTGAEIPAVKVAGKVAKRALKTGSEEKKQLLELAAKTPAMQAAADAYGKRLAVKQRIVLRLYQPLARMLGVSKAYFADQFAADLAEHVADIPDENLISPPGNIALPAMQGLAFSLDEPELKAMYLKLLAAASDDRRPYDSHPSFAQIIRELSSPEAQLLLEILRPPPTRPIARIKLITGRQTWRPIYHNVLNWADDGYSPGEFAARCAYVDNWIRLGLIHVEYGPKLAPDGQSDPYMWVTSRPEYPKSVTQPEPTEDEPEPFQQSVGFDAGVLRVTDFGMRFMRAIS
jgi:hypothetical protein